MQWRAQRSARGERKKGDEGGASRRGQGTLQRQQQGALDVHSMATHFPVELRADSCGATERRSPGRAAANAPWRGRAAVAHHGAIPLVGIQGPDSTAPGGVAKALQ